MVDPEASWRRDVRIVGLKCLRHPQMHLCGCTIPCVKAIGELHMIPVIPNVYIGYWQHAACTPLLEAAGVGAVVSVSDGDRILLDGFHVFPVTIPDISSAPVEEHFERVSVFIHRYMYQHGVLVHCRAGMSRSVTLLAAFLMSYSRCNSDEAIAIIREVRPVANPNAGFITKLRRYQNEIPPDGSGPSLSSLPVCILDKIFAGLSVTSLRRLMKTSRRFYALAGRNSVWARFVHDLPAHPSGLFCRAAMTQVLD